MTALNPTAPRIATTEPASDLPKAPAAAAAQAHEIGLRSALARLKVQQHTAASSQAAAQAGAGASGKQSAGSARGLNQVYQQTWAAIAKGVGEAAAIYEEEDLLTIQDDSSQVDDADDGSDSDSSRSSGPDGRRVPGGAQRSPNMARAAAARNPKPPPRRRPKKDRQSGSGAQSGDAAIDALSMAPVQAGQDAWSQSTSAVAGVGAAAPIPVQRANALPAFTPLANIAASQRTQAPPNAAGVAAVAWGFAAALAATLIAVALLLFTPPDSTVTTHDEPQRGRVRDGAIDGAIERSTEPRS
jgi:hypothetical protein